MADPYINFHDASKSTASQKNPKKDSSSDYQPRGVWWNDVCPSLYMCDRGDLPLTKYTSSRDVVVVVQLLSRVQLFSALRTAAPQAPLSSIISCSLLKFMSFVSVMPSNSFILGLFSFRLQFSQDQSLFQLFASGKEPKVRNSSTTH